jgi:hypothetical protein
MSSKTLKFSKICIISSNAELSEKISAHFRKSGELLPIFDLWGKIPLKESVMYGEFSNECIKTTNLIQLLNPKKVLIIGTPIEIKTEIMKRISADKILIIDSYDLDKISCLKGFKHKKYNIDSHIVHSGSVDNANIIAIEQNSENKLSDVIAKNLAVAENAKIITLPEAQISNTDEIKELFREWTNSNDGMVRQNAKKAILNILEGRIENYNLTKAKSVSFVTRGIPYGFLPFECPTTHYFSHRIFCIQILLGVLKGLSPYLNSTSVYLCDPNEFDHSESEELKELFSQSHYVVKKAYGKRATANDVRYSTEFLPIDFIFYSTHCGEIEGRKISERFYSIDGQQHTVCYDLVASFAPDLNSDLIQVTELKRWISLDDVLWSDNEEKKKIGAGKLIEEYIRYIKKRSTEQRIEDIIETSDTGIVKHSDVLKMYDFNFVPIFHQIGGNTHPLVFNNACSTWRELAVRYSIAGSSIYIGTSIDIPNLIAIEVSTKFSKFILKGKPSGFALYKAQKEYIKNYGYAPYLMNGYIFTKPKQTKPTKKTAKKFLKNLLRETNQWKEYLDNNPVKELKSNAARTVTFLESEINSFVQSRNHK